MKPNVWMFAEWRTTIAVMCVSVGAGMSGVSPFGPTVSRAADDLAKSAATVEEVAKVLDLETLPIPEGATVTRVRQLGALAYATTADLTSALEFQRKQLLKLGWVEQPGGFSEPTYAQTSFRKSDFVVAVSSSAGETPDKDKSEVFMSNLGNVKLSKLSVVNGAQSTHSSDLVVVYTTDLKPAEAAEATRKVLMDSGWEPYGSQPNPSDSVVMTFKRNAIRVKAVVGVAPNQEGKVQISYFPRVLAADLPAPTNANAINFDELDKTLRFQSPDKPDDVAQFYIQRLAKQGWTLKEEEHKYKGGASRELTFWNATKDAVKLVLSLHEGKTQVALAHFSAVQMAATQKRLAAESVANTPAAPSGPDKAKTSIAKLPKLTSVGIIMIDQETISLSHVFAYETVSQGSRYIRIFATARPIRQGPLIEKLKNDEYVNDADLPQKPYIRLEIDGQAGPLSLSLLAKDLPAGSSGSGLKGEAIVEDGRARGTFKMLKPAVVVGQKVSGEITFDVPVVTRDSQPAKLLANAKKLESSGKLLVNNKTIKLGSVVAYEFLSFGMNVTAISFTDKPIDLPKLKAQFAKDGREPGLVGFDSQVKLEIDDEDQISGIVVEHNNTSFPILDNSIDLADVIIEDGRARGTFKLDNKEIDGTKYSLDLTFDVEVLKLPTKVKE